MSEEREPYWAGKRGKVVSATAIKTLYQTIETAHDNGALFFLAQAVLRVAGFRLPAKN